MIPFEEVDRRLAALGKDRQWLAEKTGYSYASIREALAPNSKKRSWRIQREITDALEGEEQVQGLAAPTAAQNLVLEVDVPTFERWSRAALKHGEIITDYAIRAIEEAAAADLAKPTLLRAAEQAPDYPQVRKAGGK